MNKEFMNKVIKKLKKKLPLAKMKEQKEKYRRLEQEEMNLWERYDQSAERFNEYIGMDDLSDAQIADFEALLKEKENLLEQLNDVHEERRMYATVLFDEHSGIF